MYEVKQLRQYVCDSRLGIQVDCHQCPVPTDPRNTFVCLRLNWEDDVMKDRL